MTDLVPVIWITNKPNIIARHYWDQGFLEGLFDGSVWRVPGAPEFLHFETNGEDGWPNEMELAAQLGAIFVVPARHHADQIEWLNAKMQLFPSVIVILTGDEEHAFPAAALNHPRLQVWVMTPDPENHAAFERRIGTLWPPALRPALATPEAKALADERPLTFYFSGQDTHDRRHQCIEGLVAAQVTFPQSIVRPTAGFTQGDTPRTYSELLASAKIAPCPSGPVSVDTFRVWEALEAGCIPLADRRTPDADGTGFWEFVLGEEPPFPTVQDWVGLKDLIPLLVDGWPANANRVFAWWQGYRRKLAYALRDDIENVLGVPYDKTAPSDLITVIVPTSPMVSNPSLDIITETVESIRERLGDCEIIIPFDGVRPEQESMRADYEEYQRLLLWRCLHEWHNVLPLRLEAWQHQANATKRALTFVQTPLILFVEHDTPLVGDIPWAGLADAIAGGEANVIRLHHEASVLEPHRHLMLDEVSVTVGDVPLLRTAQWSQRPHLARTDWYRDMLDAYFGVESRTMIEDLIHGVVHGLWARGGITGWSRFKLWMYAPDGDMKRSTHLDGRGDEPKYPMHFAYDGPVPPLAPAPGPKGE